MMNKKGQMTVIGIIMGIVTIMTFAICLPILTMAINMGINNTNSSTLQFIFSTYPLFMGLGVLVG